NQTDPANWIQTGGIGGYTVVGHSGVNVSDNVTIVNGTVTAITDPTLAFANVHLGQQNGLTIGFWSNKNGAKILDTDKDGKIDQAIFDGLKKLHLRNADGSLLIKDMDPSLALATFQKWLTSGNANNMANMLSAQLAGTWLNAYAYDNGSTKINKDSYIDIYAVSLSSALIGQLQAPGHVDADKNGFVKIQDCIDAAAALLGTDAGKSTVAASDLRTYEEALKDIFDAINNNQKIFVS